MRLAPPPPDRCIVPVHEHTALLRALATALATLQKHEARVARTLAELGDIDLGDEPPSPLDREHLHAAGPLYFASELEAAGLLPAAELIAGLFASGAINQPLGPAGQLVHQFWRSRRMRLEARERVDIFTRAIEAPHFDRLMGALCEAIVAQADGSDVRERVTLETSAHLFAEFLSHRVDEMAAKAASEIAANINEALGFMRDRLLQTAFGVHTLWALVAAAHAGTEAAPGADAVQRHVDQGRSGQTVLLWLADHGLGAAPLIDANGAEGVELIGAAQRWLSGRMIAARPTRSSALPIAA